jgi:serine/threonine protein phosphatase 1
MLLKVKDYRKVFVCGDIHGNLDLLKKGLKKLGYDSNKDVIVTMGDVIDRGKESLETALFFLEPEQTENGLPSAVSSRGNHEDFGIDAHVKNNKDWIDSWHYHGGSWTKEHSEEVLTDLFTRIEKTFPLYIDIEFKGKNIIASHAAVPGYDYDKITSIKDEELVKNWLLKKAEELPVEKFLAENEDYLDDDEFLLESLPVCGADLSIHGHSHTHDPYLYKNRLYLDTGCLKNYLTIMTLSEDGIDMSGFKMNESELETINVDSKIKDDLRKILL